MLLQVKAQEAARHAREMDAARQEAEEERRRRKEAYAQCARDAPPSLPAWPRMLNDSWLATACLACMRACMLLLPWSTHLRWP